MASKSTSELLLRVLSAIVLIAISLSATWLGGNYFIALCVIGAIIILVEYSSIAMRDFARLPVYFGYAGLLAFLSSWILAGPATGALIAASAILLAATLELISNRRIWASTGMVYAIAPFIALVSLRGEAFQGLHAILILFGCVWGADSFAYFTGRLIGGPKLAPAISPKKTWSGFVGGILGSVGVAYAVCLYLDYRFGAISAIIAAGLGLVSSLGDLFESWIKRRFGTKDSGRIIPGHGGLLDRIDGLIFAAIATWSLGWINGGRALVPGDTGSAFLSAFILP
jgi:phosphatidate cytidylyltransferase